MSEKRGGPSSGRTKSKPMRPPVRSPYGQWWPYAIAGGVVVLVAAFVAVTQLGRGGSDGARGSSGYGVFRLPSGMDMGAVDGHSIFVLDASGRVAWKQLAPDSMHVPVDQVVAAVRAA